MRVLVLEKAAFPREKVCGDCVNPKCWPLFERLGVADEVLKQEHSKLQEIQMVGVTGASLHFATAPGERGEIAIKRSLLDQVLLTRAAEVGAEIREQTTLRLLQAEDAGWLLNESIRTRLLVAADGRNSTVARLAGLAPEMHRDRVGLQTHLPLLERYRSKVVMRLLEHGYCGIASVSERELNLCLVSTPEKIPALKAWAQNAFSISPEHPWRTVTPLSREPILGESNNLLLVGDAARVVEPFTGEGIYYALASGITAAESILAGEISRYPKQHRALYRGRLWINKLAKRAVLHPQAASTLLSITPAWVMRLLTNRVVPLGS